MSNRTLVDEIITLIEDKSNNNPPPLLCTIINNYSEKKNRVDIETETGILKYIKVIGDNKIGLEGVVVFINGDLNNAVVLTSVNLDWIDELDNILKLLIEYGGDNS